jgi:Tfp pilus assembly protein PilF
MEVAVKLASFQRRLSFARIGVIVLLGAALVGCGTDVISYNREFRQTAFAQYDKKDYLNAAQTFKAALREEPGDYMSRYFLATCYEFMNRPQEAIEEYRTTLITMSNSMEGKGDLVTRRKVCAAFASAIAKESDKSADLAMIERQQPRTQENVLMLARIYRQSGDADMALMRYDEVQKLNPNDAIVAKEYGLYLEQLGQTRKADIQLRLAYGLNTSDEEIAAALRRLGVVPGPSLKNEEALEKPVVPLGPLPEVEFTSKQPAATPSVFPVNTGATVSSGPRD